MASAFGEEREDWQLPRGEMAEPGRRTPELDDLRAAAHEAETTISRTKSAIWRHAASEL
jgi:hypothetical protein